MLMRYLSLLIIGLLFNLPGQSQASKQIDWPADIDFLAKELPNKHFNFFSVKDEKEFLDGLEKIKLSCANLTDFEVSIKLQQLISGFGDSHTTVNYMQFVDKNKILPINLNWFSDGLYILHTTHENNEILGHQLLSLNGVLLKTIQDSLSTLITKDNQAMIIKSIPNIIPLVQVLEYFGFVKAQEIELRLKDINGVEKTYFIKMTEMTKQNRMTYKPDSLALCFRNETIFFNEYYQKEDNIYYLQYNKCWSKEIEKQYGNAKQAKKMPSFKEFENRVFQTLNKNPIDKVVFDLRFNSGGSSPQGTDFINKFSKFLVKKPEMKTYVILGRKTYSSAIINAMDFKRIMNVTFIGEETSGKPNHFGEVKSFQLPNSGIKVYYSTKYFERTKQKVSSLIPEVKLSTSFSDYKNGIDPVYEWIKKQ
jgi:hypothetical protein